MLILSFGRAGSKQGKCDIGVKIVCCRYKNLLRMQRTFFLNLHIYELALQIILFVLKEHLQVADFTDTGKNSMLIQNPVLFWNICRIVQKWRNV